MADGLFLYILVHKRMRFLMHRYSWFAGLGLLVFLVFFCFRPLNSPAYRIIVADGLGYYSYLPAKFIYHDTNLEFKWFDDVFNANYADHLFEKPTQNFMVKYNDRMINLYYPGQSLLQLPFFFLAHLSAKLFNYPQDGFSTPYQVWMGVAGIFYTLLGLLFCSKLLFNISQSRRLSVYIPVLIFFATNLFTYSIFAGCYTHCYSFAFVSLSLYFAQKFFSENENKLSNLFMLGLCALIVVFLRPVNCILLLSVLYFFKPFSLKQIFISKINRFSMLVALAGILLVVVYNMSITYTQTHALIANTYTIGRFYFNDWSHVWDNFVGFQNGILWYTPVIFLAFVPLLFLRRQPGIIFLLAPVFLIILLYSFWFYWNIVNRTLVDFSGILAVLLLQLFLYFKENKRVLRWIWVLSFVSIPFFQLKAYQLRNGILNSSYTYWRYYAKYFFTLHHVDVFPVNPKTIVESQDYFYDFERESGNDITTENPFEGNKSVKLDQNSEYGCSKTFTLPSFFNKPGFKKIKAAFWFYRMQGAENIQLVFSFTKNDSVISYHPFYINATTKSDVWDFKEFGMDLPETIGTDCKLVVYFWKPDKPDKAYIDNFKLELILKNGSDEITLDK